jgi:hypothetical protein
MKQTTERVAWIVGIAAGVLAAVGITIAAKDSAAAQTPSPTPAPTGPAVSALLTPNGGALTVSVGSTVTAQNSMDALWSAPGTITSDATVLAPSQPATTNGYVAMKPGTATISGTYVDYTGATSPTDPGTPVNVSITVTVTQ